MTPSRDGMVDPHDGTGDPARDEGGRFIGSDADDAPTADVADEDVIEFLRELNEWREEALGKNRGFSTVAVTRDAPPARRSAIDPADSSVLVSASVAPAVTLYEELAEADELVAAAALRRRDSVNVQAKLAPRSSGSFASAAIYNPRRPKPIRHKTVTKRQP